jgi:hypothetical protein
MSTRRSDLCKDLNKRVSDYLLRGLEGGLTFAIYLFGGSLSRSFLGGLSRVTSSCHHVDIWEDFASGVGKGFSKSAHFIALGLTLPVTIIARPPSVATKRKLSSLETTPIRTT